MLIAVCSVKGSPGVTTLTLALALRWPYPVRRLVAEVDPAGGDLAIRCGVSATPGLVSVAATARRAPEPVSVWDHAHPVAEHTRILTAPVGGVHTRAALATLINPPARPLIRALAAGPDIVLADCGRVDPGSPAEVVARHAHALLVLTGTRGTDLAHTAARLRELAQWTPRPALVLTGSGHRTREVEHELGIPTIGRLPHDPAVSALARPWPISLRRGTSAYLRHTTQIATALTNAPYQRHPVPRHGHLTPSPDGSSSAPAAQLAPDHSGATSSGVEGRS